MSESKKPVFNVNDKLFQSLVEWQEKMEAADALTDEREVETPTEGETLLEHHEQDTTIDRS